MIVSFARALFPSAVEAVASFGTVSEKHPDPEAFSEAFKRHAAHARDLGHDPAGLEDVRCAYSQTGIGFVLRFGETCLSTWEVLS